MPLLGTAKKRIGARLDSRATIGEGVQNMLCAYLAAAVLAGLLANTWFGLWWADPSSRSASLPWPSTRAAKPGKAKKTTTIEPAPSVAHPVAVRLRL